MELSELADRQRRLIEALPFKLRSALRGKEAVVWCDAERKVTLLFLLAGESKLVNGAWEYYCNGCYIVSKGTLTTLPTLLARPPQDPPHLEKSFLEENKEIYTCKKGHTVS